jgi:hypothetical protein
MGLMWVTERTKPPGRFLQSMFLKKLLSKFPLPFCRNIEGPRHVVAIFFLALQQAHRHCFLIGTLLIFHKVSVIRRRYTPLAKRTSNQATV